MDSITTTKEEQPAATEKIDLEEFNKVLEDIFKEKQWFNSRLTRENGVELVRN